MAHPALIMDQYEDRKYVPCHRGGCATIAALFTSAQVAPVCQSPTNGASLLQAAYEQGRGVNGSWPNRAISSLTKLLVYGDDFQTPIFISHAAGYTGKL